MAELGWLSVLVPEADGGLGSGLGEMGQLVYEWGAGGGPEPLIATGTIAISFLVACDRPARDLLLASTMARLYSVAHYALSDAKRPLRYAMVRLAVAGALGLKLAGPRVYGAVPVEDAFMGDGRPDAGAADIRHALKLYRWACGVQFAVLAGLAALVTVPG